MPPPRGCPATPSTRSPPTCPGESGAAPRGSNRALYGATLAEAARLCRSGGILVALTQDSAALRAALAERPPAWEVLDERRIVQRSYRPPLPDPAEG